MKKNNNNKGGGGVVGKEDDDNNNQIMDEELPVGYLQTAKRLRQIAFIKYGCISFESTMENNKEITVSYWNTEDDIRKWKNDSEHIHAQQIGQKLWYEQYSVEVAKISRSYSYNNSL